MTNQVSGDTIKLRHSTYTNHLTPCNGRKARSNGR